MHQIAAFYMQNLPIFSGEGCAPPRIPSQCGEGHPPLMPFSAFHTYFLTPSAFVPSDELHHLIIPIFTTGCEVL